MQKVRKYFLTKNEFVSNDSELSNLARNVKTNNPRSDNIQFYEFKKKIDH